MAGDNRDNRDNWNLMRDRLVDPLLQRSPDQVPGVIVMELSDDLDGLPDLDPAVDAVLVVFNATAQTATVPAAAVAGRTYLLHAEQAGGVDAGLLRGAYVTAAGGIRVPAFSTVVFVAPSGR